MSQPPPPVVAPKGKRHKGMMIFGLVLLIVGVLGGGAIVAKGLSNYKEAVKSLARAPVGCTTTLVFDKPATFTVYAETKGKLGELSGDCEATGGEYEHPGDKLPKVSMTLLDSNGDEVDLQRGVTAKYDIDGYVGTAVRSMNIEEAGTYRLNVESDDTDFAIAIGKNPEDDNDLLMLIGGGVALGGFVLGVLFFLLGLRRRRPDAAAADIRNTAGPLPGWPPGSYTGPAPTAPPPTHPGSVPAPPPPPPTIQYPGQPPIHVPEQPPGTGFAPPAFSPPAVGPDVPSSPPTVTPPTPPAPELSGWTKPRDEDDD
jgi:hypothetical protein